MRDSERPESETQESTRRVWKTQKHRKLERYHFDKIPIWRPSRENGSKLLPSVLRPTPRLERAANEQTPGSSPEIPITIDDYRPSPPAAASVSLESSRSLMPPPPPPASRIQRVYLRCSLRLDMVHDGPSVEIREKLDRLLQNMGDYGRLLLDVDQSVHMRDSVLHICRDINCEFLHHNI